MFMIFKNGGGVGITQSCDAAILFTDFLNNRATGYGGGLYQGSSSNPDIINCIFFNNSAEQGYQFLSQTSGRINISYCLVDGGISNNDHGVYGFSTSGYGVFGSSVNGRAVYGYCTSGYGVYGASGNDLAGYFGGDVFVSGDINKAACSFLIDHPLDPENKLLRHTCVESPENLLIYRGKVQLDGGGQAIGQGAPVFGEGPCLAAEAFGGF